MDPLDRILAEIGIPDLLEVLSEQLSPTDLQSLLLAVYERRSAARTPSAVLADYQRSRFFGAASFPHAAYAEWGRIADWITSGRFEILTLSPMAPLGSCAAVANVGQDWSVATIRTGEVVSDPTNILAIEAAVRRRRNLADRLTINLATTQRVIRPQAYSNPGMSAHFSLFALVSTGRDRGSHKTEADAVSLHLDTHLKILREFLGDTVPISVSYTLETDSDQDARVAAVNAIGAHHRVPVWNEADRRAVSTYYGGFCFHVWADLPDRRRQIADGGVVDWVAKLLSNGKERSIISGCGVEAVVSLRG